MCTHNHIGGIDMNTHIVTANRGWHSEPMSHYHARKYRDMLKELGNVNVKTRRIKHDTDTQDQ